MKKMTKQKFYEEAILNSYRYAYGTALESEADELSQIPDTFAELIMLRAIHGFPDNIPLKHPFKKLGTKYVMQLAGFVAKAEDDEFQYDFFRLLKDNPDLVPENDEKLGSFFFDLYYETMMSNKYFAEDLAEIIFRNFSGCSFYRKFLSLVNATGLINYNVEYSEITKAIRNMDAA